MRTKVLLNGVNLDEVYGLKLTAYDIGTPEPVLNYIDVPARAGMLDATLALNGKVNYRSRPVSATFHVTGLRHDGYATLMAELNRLYQGIEAKMVFDFDPDWYYKGRFIVTGAKVTDVSADIVISCENAHPYKLREMAYAFVVLGETETFNVDGDDYTGAVHIVNDTMSSVRYNGHTYQLKEGENIIPEIHIKKGTSSMKFNGSGTAYVTYESGVL